MSSAPLTGIRSFGLIPSFIRNGKCSLNENAPAALCVWWDHSFATKIKFILSEYLCTLLTRFKVDSRLICTRLRYGDYSSQDVASRRESSRKTDSAEPDHPHVSRDHMHAASVRQRRSRAVNDWWNSHKQNPKLRVSGRYGCEGSAIFARSRRALFPLSFPPPSLCSVPPPVDPPSYFEKSSVIHFRPFSFAFLSRFLPVHILPALPFITP